MLHTLASYIAKVRTWGLKGVWNFFAGKGSSFYEQYLQIGLT